MAFVAAAAIIAAAASAAAQSDAARKASHAQTDAANLSLTQQQAQNLQNREDLAPYRAAGSNSLERIGTLLGQERRGLEFFKDDPRYQALFDKYYEAADRGYKGWGGSGGRSLAQIKDIAPTDYQREVDAVTKQAVAEFSQRYPEVASSSNATDPQFGGLTKKFTVSDLLSDPVTLASLSFGLSEGVKGINNMQAARGMKNSGETLKELTKFGADYVGSKANDSYNRFYADQDRIYNRLTNLAGLGQTAAINTASLGQRGTENIGGIITGAGNARGAASIAQGNAWGGAASNVGNWYTSNAALDKILASRNTTSGNDDRSLYGE